MTPMLMIVPDHKPLYYCQLDALWNSTDSDHTDIPLGTIQPLSPPILKSAAALKGPHMLHCRLFPIFALMALLGLTMST
mgnify:CR=1 FL=1